MGENNQETVAYFRLIKGEEAATHVVDLGAQIEEQQLN